MSRVKLILLSVAVAALAVAGTAASAQAHEYIVNGSPLGAGTETLKNLEQTGSNFIFTGKPLGVNVKIECSTVLESNGNINNKTAGQGKLEFSECKVPAPEGCKVKTPITTEVITALTETGEEEFKAKGASFVTITLEGCAVTEPFTVTGSQVCKLPGGTTPAVKHDVECAATGSKLKAGGKAATFEGSLKGLELTSGLNWNIT